MFPVSVWLRIESKRFVEEETQRKRLGSLCDESPCWTCHFPAVQPRWSTLLQMNERYLRWYSPWLSREFEMLAFGSGGGLPLVIFPTSFGRCHVISAETRAANCDAMATALPPRKVEHVMNDHVFIRGHDWNYWRDMLPYYLSGL